MKKIMSTELIQRGFPATYAKHFAEEGYISDWDMSDFDFIGSLIHRSVKAIGDDLTRLAFGLIAPIYDGKGGCLTASSLDPDHGIYEDTPANIAAARRFFAELRESGEEAKYDSIKNCRLLPDSYGEMVRKRQAIRRVTLKD